MIKHEKAITLIALIITIIILVILAAVSIRAVYNMGIVNHAINGTQDYVEAAKEEERILDQTGLKLEEALAKIKESQGEEEENIDFEAIMAEAKANRQGNEAIGIGTDGSIVDLSLWRYFTVNSTLSLGQIMGSTWYAGYAGSIVDGKIIGTMPQFILPENGEEFLPVTLLLNTFNLGNGNLTQCPTIPSTVTIISSYAFSGCTGLTNVTIPSTVTSISSHAFSGCTGLTNITIPSSVTYIGSNAFIGCTNLIRITVESDNPVYDSRNNCNAIIETLSNEFIVGCKTSTIPDTITRIGGGAFCNCKGLTNITIPSLVVNIGSSAFSGCTGLTNITIPSSVTDIESSAFGNCTGLTNITIPSSVTYIGSSAFGNCTGLTNITIPSSVISMGNSAFSNCTGLINVTIDSSNVASNLVNTYGGTSNLIEHATTVYIKSDITTVGSYLTSNFTKQGTSDKAGYDKYIRN